MMDKLINSPSSTLTDVDGGMIGHSINKSIDPKTKHKSAPLKNKQKVLPSSFSVSSSLSSSAVAPPYVLNKAVLKDSSGRYRIQSLFEVKTQRPLDDVCPVFTLDEYSDSIYPSFKRLYVTIGDPSEYEMAIQLLGSWEHWQRLCDSVWFRPYLNECREELNAKIRSEAISKITKDGKDAFSEATRLAANKFLATGAYMVEAEKEVVKEVAKRGRPSKEEIARRTKEILTEEGSIKADYARITEQSALLDGEPIGKA